MNVLLTTSAAPGQAPFSTAEKRPPVGVGFLISVLRDAGHNVFFIDNYLEPSNFLETDYLRRHQIDLVGIYTNTICYRDSLRMFYRLEEMRQTGVWQGKIVVGGPHASVSPETIPFFVDHIVIGEGEYAIRDIVAGKVAERIVQYPAIENLDELPMPAWDYFAELPYDWGGDWLPEGPVFTMNTSRGCPFDCTFCSVGSIWGRRYTYFSAERIVADIEYVVKQHGVKGIYFREDNFTLNKKRLYEFCNLMIERGFNIPWVCETRASSLDRETVELMTRAGAKGAYIGVESGSQRLLDFMHKGIKVDDVRSAFELCKEFGIKAAASIIVGVPTETHQDLLMTADLLKEIQPTVIWFNVFVGIPKSKLYTYVIDNNLYEYIDDRGLVYLKGHNDRVKKWYGNGSNAIIPISIENNTVINPEVSVIMSVYNGEKYLLESINSILAQTFNNLEFIIVNDASTDSTAKILEGIHDPRIRVFTNEINIGLTKSLNRALRQCRSDFVARMDADDISLPERLAKQYAFLKQNSAYGLVGTQSYVLVGEKKFSFLARLPEAHEHITQALKGGNVFYHGSVMIRKSMFAAINYYNEEFYYAQDYDAWFRLSETSNVANLPDILYVWRNAKEGISNVKKKEQDFFALLAKKYAADRAFLATNTGRCTQVDSDQMRIVAIISAHNEGDVIYHVIGDLVKQGVEVYLLNHCSTDNTVEEAAKWLGKGLIHIENFPQEAGYHLVNADKYVWYEILRRKEELAAQLGADWYIHTDADEFRESPWEGYSLSTAIQAVDRLGYTAIDFALLNFRPIDNSFAPGADVRDYLKHYEWGENFNDRQVKCWKNVGAAVDLKSSGGHHVQFEGCKVFPTKFILRHYPIRSQAHGERKVFAERKARFFAAEKQAGWHVQYDNVMTTDHAFLYKAADLIRYNAHAVRAYLQANGPQPKPTECASGNRGQEVASRPLNNAECSQRQPVSYAMVPLVGSHASSPLLKLASSERLKRVLQQYSND